MANYVDANFTKKHLSDGRTKVLNVLSADAYAQKHLPGSISLPEEDPQFSARAQQLLPDKSQPVIVHCSGMGCQASTRAARKLESLGYKEVHDFKAGLEGWEQAGLPFASGATPGGLPGAQEAQHGQAAASRPPRPGRDEASRHEEARTPQAPRP